MLKKFLKKLTIKKALLIWLVALGISVIFSHDIIVSFYGSIERMEGFWQYLLYVIFFLFLTRFFVREEGWKKLFVVIFILGTIMGLLAIWQNICGLEPEMSHGLILNPKMCIWGGNVRSDTTIGNPAFLAGYLILTIMFSGLAVLFANTRCVRWFIPAVLIQIIGLWTAGVRSSFVGAIIGVLIYLILRRFFKR